jgi:hypothetical protein
MTGAELALWAKRCRLRTQADAAAWLRLSIAAYRNKLKDISPVDGQTELLCAFWEDYLYRIDRDSIATIAGERAHMQLELLTRSEIGLAAAQRTLALLTKMTDNGNGTIDSSKLKTVTR